MSEASKAVFLSYASQDAEAAKKLCEALRAAGVEVWFDTDGGLEHGDEWDAKIRRQIKECVLFLPLISANTQAREEGYFRIEWDLAAERARGIASGVAFILPVIIDDTKEPLALVPDRFRSVQWTRLPGGNVPADVLQRFLKLWSHRAGVVKHQAGQTVAGVGDPGGSRRDEAPGSATPATTTRPKWLRPILAAAAIGIAVLAYTLITRRAPEQAVVPPAVPVPAPAAVASSVSPARELVAKARALALALDATREDFALAEEYCQRALKLDPDDGEVWAIYSQVHSAFGYRGWDTSPERREQTRTAAERAMRLAPQSANARLAQAGAWATFGINREDREKLLREILRDEPDNKEVLRFLAVTVLPKPGGLEEALALNERAAGLPGGDPLALFNNARYLWTAGQPAKGYEVLLRALAQRTFTSALVLKMGMELTWRGDLAAAEETLKEIPASALQEDRANYSAGLLRYYQRDAAGALAAWGAFPRDFYVDFIFDGPKGLLLGLAHELDHRDAAARTEWRAALQEVEKKIAAAPNRAAPYYGQAYLLACLGEKAAAGEALRTHEQLAQIKYLPGQGMGLALAKVYARLGRFDEIFAHSPPGNLAVFRISPDFDALRADPRFPQWVAAQPNAKPAMDPKPRQLRNPGEGGIQDPGPSSPLPVDSKSVAVLAFTNLSDDKANEYFSDGISEELLNVLAKISGLKVAARTSAFYFKGKEVPIPEIAKQLGVAYIVEGSVRKAGDKVRITAQLIKASDGFHVWSDTFTRDIKDVFAVQDEIAGLIARNISPMLNTAPVAKVREIAPDAYQEYLLGRSAVAKAVMSDLRESLVHFERAVAIEPKFTAAWVQLANAHTRLGRWGGAPAIPSWRAARAAIDRAVALEPDSPEVLVALGWILRTGEWKWREAERAFRRALELRPNQPDVLAGAAVLLYNIGQTEEAMRLGQRAAQLDPLNASTQIDLSIMFYLHGDLAEAETAARRALQLAPDGASYHAILSWSLIDQKRFAEAEVEIALDPDPVEQPTAYARLALARGDEATARKMIVKLEELALTNPDAADLQQSIAWICAGLGEKENDRSFAALERAKASRDPSMAWLLSSRYLLPLQSEPRWEKLKRSMGLTEDQLK